MQSCCFTLFMFSEFITLHSADYQWPDTHMKIWKFAPGKTTFQSMLAHWTETGLLTVSETLHSAGFLTILCPHPVWPACCIWHSPPLPAWHSCRTWTLGKRGWESTVNFLLFQMYLGFFSLLSFTFLHHAHCSWHVAQSLPMCTISNCPLI